MAAKERKHQGRAELGAGGDILPRRGVWAWIDRVNEFRMLSPADFETPLAFDVGFAAFNFAFALGGALLVRRALKVPWDDIQSCSPSSYRVVRDSTRADGARMADQATRPMAGKKSVRVSGSTHD
jgi:hypothetical protein